MFDKAKDSEKTTINESVRQRGDHAGAWRDSLKAIRTADNKKVLGFLDGLGNLKLSKQSEEINDAAAAWQRNREAGLDDKNNIFITNRHDMRKRLNVAAREISGQAFRIDNVAVEIRNNAGEKAGIREFAPGDRVVTLKNMKLFGRNIAGEEEGAKTRFDNRALWTINQIKVVEDKTWIEMTSDKGTVARFNTEQMATLDHAYAVTTHMSQGMTAKGSVTLPSDMNMMDMSAWYVMLSRTSNAEYSHVVIPEHLLVEMEDELGIDRDAEAEETKEQRIETLHQRLEKFMVAVARERPDDLSLSFKLAEGQAEKLASNEKHKIEAAPIAQPITEDDQLEDLSTGRRKPHQAEPEAAQPADAKKAEHEEKPRRLRSRK
jgi:hypothetical protein